MVTIFSGGQRVGEAWSWKEDLGAGAVGVQGALTLRSLTLESRAGEVPGRGTREEFHSGASLLAGVCSPGPVLFTVGVLCIPPILGLGSFVCNTRGSGTPLPLKEGYQACKLGHIDVELKIVESKDC